MNYRDVERRLRALEDAARGRNGSAECPTVDGDDNGLFRSLLESDQDSFILPDREVGYRGRTQ